MSVKDKIARGMISTVKANAENLVTDYMANITKDFYLPRNQTGITTTELNAIKTDNVYAMYEALFTGLPSGYVTKTLLGKDASNTLDIFKYDINPGKPTKTIVVATGVHPERHAIYGFYLFMKELIEHWQDSSVLTYIRFNVRIIFIPVANPYALNNGQRGNFTGVDINRNCGPESTWNAFVPTENYPNGFDYKGASWFSEVESQYIRDTLLAFPYACMLLTPHAGPWETGQEVNSPFLLSLITNTKYRQKVERYTTFVGNYLQSKYNGDQYIISESVNPTMGYYANSIGIPSFTPEWNTATVQHGSGFNDAIANRIVDWFGNLLTRFVLEPNTPAVYNWYYNTGSSDVSWNNVASGSATALVEVSKLAFEINAPYEGLALLEIQCICQATPLDAQKITLAPLLYQEASTPLQSQLNAWALRSNAYQTIDLTADRTQFTLFTQLPIRLSTVKIHAGIMAGVSAGSAIMSRFRARLIFLPGNVDPNFKTYDYTSGVAVEI